MRPVIALAGQPNSGKTTLFNGLTGSRAKVGNYPGVTVERKEGLMVVPELVARVTLLGPDNKVVARLGADVDRVSADKKKSIRGNEKLWQDGKFVHPHDACFDQDGNIYVAEWVGSGRVTKLARIS